MDDVIELSSINLPFFISTVWYYEYSKFNRCAFAGCCLVVFVFCRRSKKLWSPVASGMYFSVQKNSKRQTQSRTSLHASPGKSYWEIWGFCKLFKMYDFVRSQVYSTNSIKLRGSWCVRNSSGSSSVTPLARKSRFRSPEYFSRLLFLQPFIWWAHDEDRIVACFSSPFKLISFILSFMLRFARRNKGNSASLSLESMNIVAVYRLSVIIYATPISSPSSLTATKHFHVPPLWNIDLLQENQALSPPNTENKLICLLDLLRTYCELFVSITGCCILFC